MQVLRLVSQTSDPTSAPSKEGIFFLREKLTVVYLLLLDESGLWMVFGIH